MPIIKQKIISNLSIVIDMSTFLWYFINRSHQYDLYHFNISILSFHHFSPPRNKEVMPVTKNKQVSVI